MIRIEHHLASFWSFTLEFIMIVVVVVIMIMTMTMMMIIIIHFAALGRIGSLHLWWSRLVVVS